jgi:hypothetical protein
MTRSENKIKILQAFIKNTKLKRAQVNSNTSRASLNKKIKNAEVELRRLLSETHKAITAHYNNLYQKLNIANLEAAMRRGHVTRKRGRGA